MATADLVWTVLLFAVLVQGLFLAAVLAGSCRSPRHAARLLAALCLTLSLMIAEELVDAASLYTWFAWTAVKQPYFHGNTERAAAQGSPAPPRYRTSSLDADRKARLRDELLDYMNAETPFRDAGLTPADLAAALGISTHDLSQLVNEVLDSNFNRFVNRYRVEYVKRRLAEPETRRATLLQLAHDAGFNSKTSFNRAFKAPTGLTTSAYRRRQRHRSRPAAATVRPLIQPGKR